MNGRGDWNLESKKLYNVSQTFNTEDLIPDIKYIKNHSIWPDAQGNWNAKNKVIYNNAINGYNTDVVNVKWVNDRFVKLAGSTMTGDLNMSNNKITNIGNPTSNNDGVNKIYVDTNIATKANLSIVQNVMRQVTYKSDKAELNDYMKLDGTNSMTGNMNLGNNKIINVADPESDKDGATRGWVRKQIARFDHHSGEGEINIFKKKAPTTVTTMYLQYISGSSYDDFVITTSAPGEPLLAWVPTANTYINKIEFQFGLKANINVDFLWFTPRDSKHSQSTYWVSSIKTGTWTLNIHKTLPYDMSGAHLRTLNNSNHNAITCKVFTDLPSVETIDLKKLEINAQSLVVSNDLDMSNHKIKNLSDPVSNEDAINKKYLSEYVSGVVMKPVHHKNVFGYAMQKNQWSEEDTVGDTFDIVKVDDLLPQEGNFHTYNHKVLYMTIKKNSQGGYKWEMGLNVYTLKNGVSYTLCIEFLFGDLALGAKANISVNKSTSTGVTITNTNSRAFQHLYTDNRGNHKTIIYHRLITTFYKSGGNPHILHINVEIPQRGSDLSSYPSQYNKVYIIAYGVIGVSFDINANEVYDYHTAFDIKPTEVVYNVDLDMNRKKILNIAPDKTKNNSAATVKMVKDLEVKLSPHTTNNAYRKIFEEFYDFGDASNYKIVKGPSGIEVTGLSPNITCLRTGIANIWEGGMRLTKTTLSLQLFSKKSFTLCVVMQLWLNRAFSIKTLMSNGAHEKPHLIYDKTTKKLTLQTNGLRAGSTNKTSITLLNSFENKRVVLLLTKKGTGNNFIVKTSVFKL